MKQSLINYWLTSELITDKSLINSFKKIKREDFIPEELRHRAYDDVPLAIGYNQTISQPTTVMIMLQALELKEKQKVLEIGTGSGYNAALISEIIKPGKLYTTEIVPELAEEAKEKLKNFKNITVISTKKLGYREQAPYDRIIVTAASPRIPDSLVGQLKVNGIMLIPVGPRYSQEMLKITKKKDKLDIKNLGDFIFVPLVSEEV